MFPTFLRCSAVWLGMTLAAHVQAGVVINTTRVIYPAADKEVSFVVQNSGTAEILAQSWLEADADSGLGESLPFAITPGLAKMAGNARQLIRIIYAGEGMPADRESVLWLNVQEIPQSGNENELQIAIRQRIKMFYRPQGLNGDPLKAAEGLQWQVRDGQLEVSNPGAYHVSMIKLDVRQQGATLFQTDSRMLAPRQRLRFPLKQGVAREPVELSFISINDFGAQEAYRALVSGEPAAQAEKVEARRE
ncbi:molecular chaperone [Pseudomonas sp. NPDC090202]|uniref:fimbrial biogenesis chaperone n=1 Tax=unclassified Pseudomonas TaxID=196821 RepID=UPI0037FB3D23